MSTEGKSVAPMVRYGIAILVGAALIWSPWIYKFSGMTGAATSAWVGGAALVALGVAGLVFAHAAATWGLLAVGLYLLAAPWVVKFSSHALATQSHAIIGALMIGLALRGAMMEGKIRSRVTAPG